MLPQLQRFGWIIEKKNAFIFTSLLMKVFVQITRPRYSSPYSWPLSSFLAYQKQWEVRRKMNAIGWGGKTLEQVRNHFSLSGFTVMLLLRLFYSHTKDDFLFCLFVFFIIFQVYEDVSQCCQALSQRLGTQPFFFNKQYVSNVSVYPVVCRYLWVNLS